VKRYRGFHAPDRRVLHDPGPRPALVSYHVALALPRGDTSEPRTPTRPEEDTGAEPHRWAAAVPDTPGIAHRIPATGHRAVGAGEAAAVVAGGIGSRGWMACHSASVRGWQQVRPVVVAVAGAEPAWPWGQPSSHPYGRPVG